MNQWGIEQKEKSIKAQKKKETIRPNKNIQMVVFSWTFTIVALMGQKYPWGIHYQACVC